MRRAALVLLLPVFVVSGCHVPEPRQAEVTAWRLVDAPTRRLAEARDDDAVVYEAHLGGVPATRQGPARAVIEDDMRYTFARAPLELTYRDEHAHVPEREDWALETGVPPGQEGCEQLFAQVMLSAGATNSEQWAVGTCTGPSTWRRLQVRFTPPEELRGQTADLWVHVRPVVADRAVRRLFVVDHVPRDARLAFSYGVERPGWEPWASAATFHVFAAGEAAPLFYARLDPAAHPAQRKWYEASLDLAPWAGRPVQLILQTSLDRASDRRSVSEPVWGDPRVLAVPPDSAPRPWNVLLVSLDTLRARSVGAYGRERPTTPSLDALAREGTLFERAFAPASNTPPSHMSLFTGLTPSSHGVTGLSTVPMAPSHTTLAELLRNAGYTTGAVTEDGLLLSQLGFERGFDAYRENKSPNFLEPRGHIEKTFRAAAHWLEVHRTEPFFLFVHTYQVHDPYNPPAGYLGRFGPTDIEGPTAELDRYEEGIRYADDVLAKLWSQVQALGLAGHTILVVTSDHGEEFAEHGAMRHGASLYDESIGIPLIMRAPGLIPAGLRVPEQVGLIDVAPTLVDLLGLAPLAEAEGTSLAPLLRTDDAARAALRATLEKRTLVAEAWAPFRLLTDGSFDPEFHAPNFAHRSRELKLIWAPPEKTGGRGRLEAYDLAADPMERRDLAANDSERYREGRHALEAYATSSKPGAAAPQATAAPAAPDFATEEKLRALGYVR